MSSYAKWAEEEKRRRAGETKREPTLREATIVTGLYGFLSHERELSHLISDIATYSPDIARNYPDYVQRLIAIRDELRKELRRRGYKGMF